MRSTHLFILSGVLLVVSFALLFSNFHGSVTLSGAAPVSGASFDICGSSKGAWPMVALVVAITSVLLFIVAVVRAFAYETSAVQKDNVAQVHK